MTSRPRPVQLHWALLLLAFVPAEVAHADAPQGRYTIPAAGTVRDVKTSLTWQQTLDARSFSWSSAKDYCTNLQLQGAGWRLPSVKELQTLVDRRQIIPAIDRTFFPNTPADEFWTANQLAGFPSGAWYLDFYYGSTSYGDVGTTYRVRCVR